MADVLLLMPPAPPGAQLASVLLATEVSPYPTAPACNPASKDLEIKGASPGIGTDRYALNARPGLSSEMAPVQLLTITAKPGTRMASAQLATKDLR